VNQPTAIPQTSTITTLKYLFRAMRPKQWVKNAFVFAGIVFAEQHLFTDLGALAKTGVAFMFFCLISSSVYLINDLADIERDRQHPRKRLRPLASGKLSPALARSTAIILSLGCLGLSATIGFIAAPDDLGWIWFSLVLLLYFLLQVAYTFALKNIVIIDLFAIASGFVLRAIGGAAILSVTITSWWLMCVLFLALFLGLGKRRNELQVLETGAGEHRRILQEYSPQFLEQLLTIDVACTIIAYSMATFTAPSVPKEPYPFLMLTIPFVVYAMFRYLYLIIQKGEGGEPAELLFRDRPFLISILAWGGLVLAILMVGGQQG
jgi:4-hydroxybenzoate polyprenyltransferase